MAKKKETTTDLVPVGEMSETVSAIMAIATSLDQDGQEFLLDQAKAVQVKFQYEAYNRELNAAAGRRAKARRQAATPDYQVTIERNDDYFVVQLDQARIFFNVKEMREITRICHKVANPTAGSRRLFAWFDKERSDFLADTGITSDRSPYLAELYDQVVTTYKVKED